MSFSTQNNDAQGIKVHSYQLAIQYFTPYGVIWYIHC